MPTVEREATREHWDALAATYDAAKARRAPYYRSLLRLVGDSVPASQRGRVLEAGCGTGQILASLAPRRGLGIDASPRMIEQARRRHAGRPELEFRVADAATSGAVGEAGGFDAVVCADVMEHVPDWRAVIDGLLAALRPGGVIAITTPNPAWALPLWILETLRLKMPEGPHRYVSRGAISARLREAGCSILHCGTHLILPAHLLGLGPRVSARAAALPVLRRLGVIQLVVATRDGREPS